MLLNRSQLKEIKKDIQEQLKAGINESDLYINGFYYSGDNAYVGNKEEAHLGGKVTKKELIENECEDYKVHQTNGLLILVEDGEIQVQVQCNLIDKYDCIIDEYITLSI